MVSFARTYNLRVLFDLPPLARAAHQHGLIATVWLGLHYTQARLIAANRFALHRRLGLAAAGFGRFVLLLSLPGRLWLGHTDAW